MLFIVVVIKKVFIFEMNKRGFASNNCQVDSLFPSILGMELELFIVNMMLEVVKKV
jgi:hypothetical protein